MKSRSLSRDARLYLCPFLLGGGQASRRLSAKIFFKYRISPFILSKKLSLLDLLCPWCSKIPLTPTTSRDILCQELLDLARREPQVLHLLIPCTPEYAQAVEKNRSLLEETFIIRRPSELLLSSPISDF